MSNPKANIALKIGNILAFIITLTVNGLASTSILGGKTTAEISNQYATLITPAGYVFAIWGIIYALLAVFVIYQALPSQKSNPFQKQVSWLFILSSVFNIAWIFLWQYNYIALSVALIGALWASLAALYLRLQIGKSNAPFKEKVCVQLPFSVYFGWITVATFADIAAALSFAGWVKWTSSDLFWGILLAAAVLIISLAVVAFRKDVAYGLVIIWAFTGIAVNQSAVPNIVYVAELGAIVVTVSLVAVIGISRLRKSKGTF
jgi:translocator protein